MNNIEKYGHDDAECHEKKIEKKLKAILGCGLAIFTISAVTMYFIDSKYQDLIKQAKAIIQEEAIKDGFIDVEVLDIHIASPWAEPYPGYIYNVKISENCIIDGVSVKFIATESDRNNLELSGITYSIHLPYGILNFKTKEELLNLTGPNPCITLGQQNIDK